MDKCIYFYFLLFCSRYLSKFIPFFFFFFFTSPHLYLLMRVVLINVVLANWKCCVANFVLVMFRLTSTQTFKWNRMTVVENIKIIMLVKLLKQFNYRNLLDILSVKQKMVSLRFSQLEIDVRHNHYFHRTLEGGGGNHYAYFKV